ncbi:MAG: GIY-YIG nuclease family protein [Candidatus Acidiferrales bacterium]
MRVKAGFVYILAGKSGVLYTGVTSVTDRRLLEHRRKRFDGFTNKYNVSRLVYWERLPAIARERQIKGWLRAKKIALIETMNSEWPDLADDYPSRTHTT